MPNLAATLKNEISRLARKEIRDAMSLTKRASAKHRRGIAELKRQVQVLTGRLAFIEKQEKKRVAQPKVSAVKAETARFSPKWLQSHREKLWLSAADYAKLVGVSPQSIYNWEIGETTPRQAQVAKLAAVRGLGKREVLRRLELLES